MGEITERHIGAPVVLPSGREVATVRELRVGDAFVEPMPDIDNTLRITLGWGGDERDLYRLDSSYVQRVTNGTVRIADPR